jgi:hypothetical protein
MELKVHYPVHNGLSLVPIPSHLIQLTSSHPISLRTTLILSSHLCPGLESGVLISRYPANYLLTFLSSPIRPACPSPFILRDLLTLITFSEGYRSPRYETSASVLPLPPSSVLISSSVLSTRIGYYSLRGKFSKSVSFTNKCTPQDYKPYNMEN